MPEQSSAHAAAVVVPTKNRAGLIARLLEELDRQGGPSFEVVVVDDGSTDGTSERVESVASELAIPVRLIRTERSRGPASARNLGWRATCAPVVVFTDDDCIPGPSWVAALLETLDREAADLVTGVTVMPEDQIEHRTLWSHCMVDDGRTGHYPTCNIAYRREVLEALSGFDEQFQYGSRDLLASAVRGINGEDTDLAWRSLEMGFRSTCAEEAVVYHDVLPQTWVGHVRNMRRLEGIVLLHKKHPQLRAHFGRRLFYRTEDVAVAAVVAGLVGFTVPRLRPLVVVGALGAAWHAYIYARYKPRPTERGGYAVAVPKAFVADAYAVLVMLRASLRYRTLLV